MGLRWPMPSMPMDPPAARLNKTVRKYYHQKATCDWLQGVYVYMYIYIHKKNSLEHPRTGFLCFLISKLEKQARSTSSSFAGSFSLVAWRHHCAASSEFGLWPVQRTVQRLFGGAQCGGTKWSRSWETWEKIKSSSWNHEKEGTSTIVA